MTSGKPQRTAAAGSMPELSAKQQHKITAGKYNTVQTGILLINKL